MNKIKEKINSIKINEKEIRKNKKITRNDSGQAIIKCNKGNDIIVDDDKWNELLEYKLNITNKGYVTTCINKKRIYLHIYLMNPNSDEIVDHINHNKLDNRLINLRISNLKNNAHNKSVSANSSSKYKGVSFIKSYKKFRATIQHNNISYNIGDFHNEEYAAVAYNLKAIELYGTFASINNIDDKIVQQYKKDYIDVANPNKKIKNTTSTFRGVSKSKNKWQAIIYQNYKHINLGLFDNEVEAAIAYNNKATELLGDKAKLNIIP